jgi:hypothetical protein
MITQGDFKDKMNGKGREVTSAASDGLAREAADVAAP